MNENIDDDTVNEVYNIKYFKLVKNLQSLVGLWPYNAGVQRIFRQCIMYIFIIAANIPLVNAVRIWYGKNIDRFCENAIGVLYLMLIFLKLSITRLRESELKNVYRQVAINWLTLTDPEEQKIMIKYAEMGRIRAYGYFVYMCITGIVFSQAPMIPIILDIIVPLNQSRGKVLFIKGEFIIDPFEHYYKLYVFFMGTAITTLAVLTSVDTTFTVVAHQNLGIFSVVMHRLKMATLNFDPKTDFDYKKIVQAVHLHKEALKFIELMKSSYSFLFLFVIGSSILFFSFSAVVALSLNTMFDQIRLITINIGAIIHLFYLSWPGQMLINHGQELFVSIYSNEWYNISQKAKKLLHILMLRSMKPCNFTAVGLYVMNFENFGSIIRTTLSYITVAVSLR